MIVLPNGKSVFTLSYILFLANTACGHVNTIMLTCEVLCQMKGVIRSMQYMGMRNHAFFVLTKTTAKCTVSTRKRPWREMGLVIVR